MGGRRERGGCGTFDGWVRGTGGGLACGKTLRCAFAPPTVPWAGIETGMVAPLTGRLHSRAEGAGCWGPSLPPVPRVGARAFAVGLMGSGVWHVILAAQGHLCHPSRASGRARRKKTRGDRHRGSSERDPREEERGPETEKGAATPGRRRGAAAYERPQGGGEGPNIS